VTEDMFKGSEFWWEPPADAEIEGAITFHLTEATRQS
jgi:hypothetical protein